MIIILTEPNESSYRPLNGAAPSVYVSLQETWRGDFHYEPDADTDPGDRALYEEAATHPNAVTAYNFRPLYWRASVASSPVAGSASPLYRRRDSTCASMPGCAIIARRVLSDLQHRSSATCAQRVRS